MRHFKNVLCVLVLHFTVLTMLSGADVLSASTTVPLAEAPENSGTVTMSVSGADATNSVTLTWTAPGDDGMSGTATLFDIRYHYETITGENWPDATHVLGEPTPQVAGTVQMMVVTGLTPGTNYFWAIKAADEVPNWSALSNVVLKGTANAELAGDHFVSIAGLFNNDAYPDVGLWDTLSGTIYIADRDTLTNEFNPRAEPIVQNWHPGSGRQLIIDQFIGDQLHDLLLYCPDLGSCFVLENNAGIFSEAAGRFTDGSWTNQYAMGGPNDFVVKSGLFSVDQFADLSYYHPSSGKVFVAFNWNSHSPPEFIQDPGPNGSWWIKNWGVGTLGVYRPFTGQLVGGDGFNPDGRTDHGLYHPGTGRLFAAKNEQHEYFQDQGLWLNGWAQNPLYRHYVGRMSADYYDDLIFYYPPNGRFFVAWNWGTSFSPTNGINANGSWLDGWATETASTTWQVHVIDVTQDGFVDIIAFSPTYGSWFVARNRVGESVLAFAQVDGTFDVAGSSWLSDWGKQTAGGAAKTVVAAVDESEADDPVIPKKVELNQNYPNPFNPSTTISFTLPEATNVTLDVYNIKGQLVMNIFDDYHMSAGYHAVRFSNTGYASGVYIYRLATGKSTQSKKMILLK